ncbi:hypothetical protein QBC46DRAFT_318135 [Diplogelasinospora grovesii]|uniref:Zn(2)-C6 fungal-type domain-containing protein n=1 Tax=Diplogelasinospora grovesii TaxID=303347 RepID=A0AAN6N301_9PEZI|nr:hypothetical protein QBC46DRAFT_318135 [Diplogelasinospora grovesii]
MSSSLSAIERGNPPPRRKSCAGCIRAKRRCTLETPACLRCAQRNLDCKYPHGTTSQRRRPRGVAPTDRPAISELAPPAPDGTPPDVTFLNEAGLESFSNIDLSSLWLNAPPTDNLHLELVSPGLQQLPPWTLDPPSFAAGTGAAEMTDVYDDPLTVDTGLLPSTTLINAEECNLTRLDEVSMSVIFPTQRSVRPRSDMAAFAIRTRLRYAIDIITAAPRQTVLENGTPWCHAHLYEDHMPRSMQDAHSSCALHMAKTAVNSHIISRSIQARVDDLLATPLPNDTLELLARTHALLLYQIIQFFDGDIVDARAAAENSTQPLEDAALALMVHINFHNVFVSDNADSEPEELSLFPLADTREFWENWVIQESARRTFLMTAFFVQAWRLLRGDLLLQCDGKLFLCHSFTLSAHLWDAKNPVDFAVAWREKKPFVIKNANFHEAFSEAKADDIGQFGKILITVLIGIDEARGWLLTRGGDL